MSKISAVGSKGYFGGYDLSGDITSLGGIVMSADMQDVTTLEDTGMERILLRRDGSIGINAVFNPTVGRAHPVLSALPNTDIGVMWAASATPGDICAMLMAKQANYVASDGANGAMLLTAQANASMGAGTEWGQIITAGKRTDATATGTGTGVAISLSTGTPAAINIASASAANPTSVLTATAHGLATGDTVVIAGATKTALNANWTVTVVDATHFTVACNLTAGASTGGTMTRTSSATGWAAQLQVFAFTGTSVTVTLQDDHEVGS